MPDNILAAFVNDHSFYIGSSYVSINTNYGVTP